MSGSAAGSGWMASHNGRLNGSGGQSGREDTRTATFMQQLRALIIRNVTLKKRDKRRTILEVVMPLYWMLILVIIRVSLPDTVYEPIETPHGQAPLMASLVSLTNHTLHVAPDNAEVRNVSGEVADLSLKYGAKISLQYYKTEEDLESIFQSNHSIDVAAVFSKDPLSNKSYTLRFNPATSPLLPKATSRMSAVSECRQNPKQGLQMVGCSSNGYFFSGFSALQTIIDVVITRLSTSREVAVPVVTLQNFPRGGATISGAGSLRIVMPMYMVFAWAQFIMYMMMLVVEEKEKKVKQSMTMMGLRDSVYWLSWFSVYAVYVLVLAAVSTTLLFVSQILMHTNAFLLLLLFILYGCSSIMFGFLLTPFFNKSRVAGIMGNLIQISLSMLFFLQLYLEDQIPSGVFWVLALFSPCAFSFAMDKVLKFDLASTGLSFKNIWDGPGLPVAGSLIMISVDIILYLFLAFYMDNVIPSEYGTKRKPWFIFQKSFWVERHGRMLQSSSPSSATNAAFEGDEIPPDPDIEPVSREVTGKPAVRIRNMKKTFYPRGKEPVRAVKDFSLDIYEGQITAILGHNGAGKTTLFNILTGMINPTDGSATVFGMDISDLNDLTEIRRITGVCPQHDIIFPNLTPMEHLRFFATIRGVPASRIESEVDQTLKEVFLYDKRNARSSDLSGGQKRKLSIGIALIGDPKIIFLDEPTAGVDAYSRRKLWSLLKNRKEGKVILLTTHFMDEADILSDRKAIMSQGRLRCCGSSLFLKNRFGLGYHLTLVVRENSESEAIGKVLQEAVPQAQLARYYGKEMSFILPSDSSPQFPTLFRQLDESIHNTERNIGVEGYGVSMTSLEEVFLALNEDKEEELGAAGNLKEHSPSVASSSARAEKTQEWRATNNSGFIIESVDAERTKKRAFMALFRMRLTVLMREPAAIFFLVMIPLSLVCGSIALSNAQTLQQQQPIDTLLSLATGMYHPGNFGALLHNRTDHTLPILEGILTSADMLVASYSGNYTDIVETRDNMAAFDIASFPPSVDLVNSATTLTLGFNDSYVHVIPILVNLISNAILSSVQDDASINTSAQMFPQTTIPMYFNGQMFSAPLMIGFAFTLIPAGLTMDLVYDREIKAKSMLRLNGIGFHLYFFSYLLVLAFPYVISYCGMLIIIAAFQVESLVCPPAFATVAILYTLFMPCAMLSSAVMSYMFNKSETARQFYPSLVTMLGMATYTLVSIIDMTVPTDGVRVSLILHIVMTILCPFYIPFGLMYFITKVYLIASFTGVECEDLTVNDYMTTEIIVLYVVTILNTPLYYLLLRVVDTMNLGGSWRSALKMQSSSIRSSPSDWDAGDMTIPEEEDEDVTRVRNHVASVLGKHPAPSPLLIYDLGKVYKKGNERNNSCKKQKESNDFTALRSVSLEVKSGEVFGLLGPNGAGKTTSLRIMTAEEQASKGKVQMCGEDIVSSMSSVFQVLGYCPQHDALWANTTVAEHIRCYAEIRGVKKDQINCLVDTYLKGLEIEEHKNKKTKNCSGGTKRKLSYILSMLGKPQVVLLDEPSTGMDPKSKRFLWNSILSSFKGERSAILTTHSMEEADALCSAIGILVRGSMRCIGPVQHLKNKYGGGYSLEVKVRQARKTSLAVSSVHALGSSTFTSDNDVMQQVQSRLNKTLPNAVLDEQFGERLVYKVPQADVKSLVLIFQVLETAKSEGLLDEYALSQTTLEHVFLQFARQQEVEDGEDEDEEVAARQQDCAIEMPR